MPITATFTADFTKWNEALKSATANLKPLEVSAKGVTSQLERMARSLSGEKIIKEAQLATAAVQKIGGVTKLTAQEQAKLNATVTEAIAKYAALGQKAPADMLALAKATEAAAKGTEKQGQSVTQMIGAYAAGIATFETAKRAVAGLVQFLDSSVDSYKEAEAGQKRLTVALQNSGRIAPGVIDQYNALATEFQNLTTFSDDAITSTEILFTQIGNVGPENMKVALQATTDLAEGLGIDLEQAATAVAKATEGQTKALQKLAPSLDAAALKGGDVVEIAAEIEKHFGGQAAAAVDTYAGRIKQLANDWDNVKEAIGGAIAQDAVVKASLASLTQAFRDASEGGAGLSLQAILVGDALADGNVVLALTINKLYEYATAANNAREATRLLAQAKQQDKDASAGTGGSGVPDGFVEQLKEAQAAIAKLTDAERKQIAAAQDLHIKNEDLVKSLNEAHKGLNFTEEALNVYTKQQKDAAEATKKNAKEAEDLHNSLVDMKFDVIGVATAIEKIQEAQNKLDLASEFEEAKQELDQVANRIDKVFTKEREWTEGSSKLLQNKSTIVKDYFNVLLKQQEASHKGWTDFEKDIEALSQAFADLAQISGGTLGKILTGLGKVVGAANLGLKAFDSIKGGIEALGKKGLSNLIGGISNLASGLLSAAAAAVTLGKALIDAFTKSRPEQLQESVLHDFGVSIGEDLGKTIADSAITEFKGSFQAAQIGNLDKIISAGGGVTVQNLDKLLARLHDVFSLLETGELTAAQGQDILNKNFGTFVDFLGGKVTPALKEIIRLNEQFGTQSKAIADFVDSEATKALQALTKVITARGSLVDQLAKAKPGSDESKKLAAQLAAQPLTAAGAKAEGSALFGIFAQLTKDGASFIDTLTQMQPVIDSLNKQLAQAGLEGGAAFAKLTQLAGIATDEIAGPAFQAIQGFGQALEALNNSNLLDQETFTGLTEQITATFEAARASLVAQGKDGSAALHLIAPQLQEIWELQQDFGYAVDAATQALIDQGVAAGEVGEKHRSIQEQTLDVLKAIADVLGATIPGAAEDAAKAIDGMGRTLDQTVRKIPEDIHIGVKFDEEKIKIPKIPDVHVRIQYDQEAPEAGRVIPLSAGGVAHFANGGMVPTAAMLKRAAPIYAASGFFAPRGTDTVPAMLTPGEFVINRQGVNAVGLPTLKGINHGTLPGSGSTTTVNVYVNQRLDEAESRKLAAAIAPHIPGAVANGGSTHGKWQRMTQSLAK